MSFVLRMALRELRGSWRRLLFFFLSLAVGVAAVVGVRSLVGSVRAALLGEARGLLAADLLIQTNRELDPALRAELEAALAGAPVRASTDSIVTGTMARPADPARVAVRLVELRGVEPAFPLHGQIVLADGRPYDAGLLRDHGAIVAPELLAQLDLRVGDALMLGQQAFTIRAVALREPGRQPGAFSLGPRVLVALADLRASGLLTFGSRARHQRLMRVDDAEVEPLAARLRHQFAARYVSVRTLRGAAGEVDSGLQRTEGYLGLVGFAVLVLGGIGVASVVRVFVQERLKSLAVLKCLGASGAQVLAIDLAQVLVLGAAGTVSGVLLAGAALRALPSDFGQALGAQGITLTRAATIQGLVVGCVVALVCALPPLLEARRVKPLLLLREERATPARRTWSALAGTITVALVLVALAAWQAGSWSAGLVASAGFALVALALHLLGGLLVRGTTLLATRLRFPWKQALLRLGRPGNQTRPVLLAVGLGSFFVLAVAELQANLLAALSLEARADAPDMFLLDVQGDQAEGVRRLVQALTGAPPRFLPILRARVTGVRGRSVNLDGFEDVRGRGSLAREYALTERDHLEANERVIAGRFWDSTRAATPEVSIERSLRTRFGIEVGDEVRFDVLGRVVSARVTSVREVIWSDVRSGGFMFVFRPGALDGAPFSFLGLVRGPTQMRDRALLQRDLSTAFPNVSSIDLREALATLRQVTDAISRAVTVVGLVTLLSGVLILLGSVAVTRRRRRYEAAVLRTLGARARALTTLLLAEYAVLGALAGLIGALGALVLGALACRQLLDTSYTPGWERLALGVLGAAVSVACVGLLASLDVLRRKPLGVLRAE
jgi:putative ABC transport system permease protein